VNVDTIAGCSARGISSSSSCTSSSSISSSSGDGGNTIIVLVLLCAEFHSSSDKYLSLFSSRSLGQVWHW